MAQRARTLALYLMLSACLSGLAGCKTAVRAPDPLVGEAPAVNAPVVAQSPVVARSPDRPTTRVSSFFAGLDPLAARVDVRPTDVVAPLRAEQVLIASITDSAGRPLPGRRVEWTLEGPGAIVDVDDRGRLLIRGGKTDDQHAVGFTEHFERRVVRTNSSAFTILPGQSWCIVSGTADGDTHVTAYAPEVANGVANRALVVQHWGDAAFTGPPPSAGRPGTEQFLSTSVFRRDDRRPLAGYAVRYHILDGPAAVFLPAQTTETVVVSNTTGAAPVVVSQTAPLAGRTRIGFEVLRAGNVVVGHGETYADWQGANVSLTALLPSTTAIGQETPCTLVVNNAGAVDARYLTVRTTIPEGCRLIRTEPPANQQGQELIWTVGAVNGRSQQSLQAILQPDHAGAVTVQANMTTEDGRRDDKTATCAVTPPLAPKLKVTHNGPDTSLVGAPVAYQITVQNEGTGPATNVMLKAAFGGGLEYADGQTKAETSVGTLAAGESRTVILPAHVKRIGDAKMTVTAFGDGGLVAPAERSLKVHDPRMTLKLTGPAHGYVGQPAQWDLKVCNVGDEPLTQATISDILPPGLVFVEATEGGRLQGRQVVWNIASLAPNEQKQLRLTTTSPRPTPQTTVTATATARASGDGPSAADVRVKSDATINVLGLPSYKMTVEDRDDPVSVGGRTAYRIQVTNTGSLPGDHVQVTATIPAQMRVLTAYGPTAYRVDGGRILFAPLASLSPGQMLTYIVEVGALKAGEARFRAELTTGTMREPLVKEESTNVR
jgi:uncharacterized repeat protein (TIGR01451 family)